MKVKSKFSLGLTWIVLFLTPAISNAWWSADDWCSDEWSNWNYQLTGDAQLSGGYRNDELSATINSFSAPGVFLSQDKLKIKDINVWEVGGKGRLALGNIYLRGYVYTGWGDEGKYSERVSDGTENLFVSKAHVHSTRTQDAIVGLGYMFTSEEDCDSNTSWGIGPIAGWSYNHQRIKLKHGITNGAEDPAFNGLVYKNRWSGPWLGFDIIYSYCNFSIDAGYEFHWANWNAEWLLNDTDVLSTAFSDRRRSKSAHGNVVYINGYWNFACGWDVGIGGKFQEWDVRRGHSEPIAGFAALDLPDTSENKVKHAKWCSAEVTLNLVYNF